MSHLIPHESTHLAPSRGGHLIRPFQELDQFLREVDEMELGFRGLHLLVHLHLSATGKRLKDLASAIGVSSASITGIADQLEAKGLVVREIFPNDRRSIYLTLTPQGTRFAAWIGNSLEKAFGDKS